MDLGNEETSAPKRCRREVSTVDGDGVLVDRLSNQPGSIISQILSLIPTKSAVTTSFLAKSWKLRWTKIASFDFDDELWPETAGAPAPAMNFVEFVNLVFAHNMEFIHNFRLRWNPRNLQSVYLNIWLSAAIARNCRVLDVAIVQELDDEDYDFDLPAALYTSGTLETVKLRGHFMIKLPHVVHLPKVAVLELIQVEYETDESVEKLVSACPLLQSLKMDRRPYGPDNGKLLRFKVSSLSLKRFEINSSGDYLVGDDPVELVIDTPSLEHLAIENFYTFKELNCVHVMPLNEVRIDVAYDDDHHHSDGMARLLQACSSAKVMHISELVCVHLFRNNLPLPASFGRLTKLSVQCRNVYWSYLIKLIDRCPNLEVVNITSYDARDCVPDWSYPVCVPACFSSSLKCVYFYFLGGMDVMLTFLLDHCLLLDRLNLTFSRQHCSDGQKVNVLKQILMLPRASTKCKISCSFQ